MYVKRKENKKKETDPDRRFFLSRTAALAAFSLISTQAIAGKVVDHLFSSPSQDNWDNNFDTHVSEKEQSPQVSTRIPLFHPETLTFTILAIDTYSRIVEQGGWPSLLSPPLMLELGARDPIIRALRQRLMISGDLLEQAGLSESFDTYVDSALRRFQNRHGLSETGALDEHTLTAMNVPAQVRLAQLKTNLIRLRSMERIMPWRYVVVNIPAAQVEAVENDHVILRHTAIVGKIDRQTPIMNSKITEIIINPYWNVPRSIILKDIIPLMRDDPEYLTRNNIHVLGADGRRIPPHLIDWNTEDAVKYRLRQDPGKINAMASVKINFPSPSNVYMHDTPLQSMFDKLMRFDTSGCVRVRNIRDLVTWILKNTKNWNRRRFEDTIKGGINTPVNVSEPVPLYFTYISAWSSKAGIVQFRHDIYSLDMLEVN